MTKLIDYLRDTRAEMRHVSWPTRSQTINYTIIVVLFSIAVGIFLGLLDFVFTGALKSLLYYFHS